MSRLCVPPPAPPLPSLSPLLSTISSPLLSSLQEDEDAKREATKNKTMTMIQVAARGAEAAAMEGAKDVVANKTLGQKAHRASDSAKATAQGTVDDVSSTDDDHQDYRTERYDELEDEAEDEEGAAAVEMKKFAKKEAKGVLGGTLRDVRRLLRDCDCVSFVTAAYAAAQTVHDYLIAPFKEVGTGVVERRSRVPPIHSSSSTHQINESTDGSALVVGTTHTNDERPVRP